MHFLYTVTLLAPLDERLDHLCADALSPETRVESVGDHPNVIFECERCVAEVFARLVTQDNEWNNGERRGRSGCGADLAYVRRLFLVGLEEGDGGLLGRDGEVEPDAGVRDSVPGLQSAVCPCSACQSKACGRETLDMNAAHCETTWCTHGYGLMYDHLPTSGKLLISHWTR